MDWVTFFFFIINSCMWEWGYVVQPRMTCRSKCIVYEVTVFFRTCLIYMFLSWPASYCWLHLCLIFSCEIYDDNDRWQREWPATWKWWRDIVWRWTCKITTCENGKGYSLAIEIFDFTLILLSKSQSINGFYKSFEVLFKQNIQLCNTWVAALVDSKTNLIWQYR